ncbi:MAG: replication/maintenance protein RepL [Candidatus Phlomobacter fragariae]
MMESKNSDVMRYKQNPFVENMMIPIGTKQIRLSKMGKDRNVLVNQLTGEVLGTHVTTYKKVDRGKFIKLFAENIAMTFELGSAGLKALNVLIFTVQNSGMNKDRVVLDKYALEEFLSDSGQKLSQATFTRGIKELVGAQIIARCLKQGDYFINPNFIFNGDRVAFTTAIEKED